MRRTLLVALICLGTPVAAQDTPDAAAPSVVVRQSIDPATGAVIGQHVALRVDVLFEADMPHPPRVSLPDVAGLQALRFETQGTTLRESGPGGAYVGQQFEFALYARRGGIFQIPPASVTLLNRQGDVTGTAQGQPITLHVIVPSGVDPSGPVVATRALTLDEQWAPNPATKFKPGDAIVRTITRTAVDVPGLAMRDLAFPAPKGVRTYMDPPEIDDRNDRGVVTGRRVDRVTYVFERGGHFQLSSATQPWWDLNARTLESANAAGTTIDIAAASPNPAASTATARAWLPWMAAGVVLLVILGVAFVHRSIRRRAVAGDHAEHEAFAALRRACAGTDASAIYRAFYRWRYFLNAGRSESATQAAASLGAAVFAGGTSVWTIADSRSLVARLVKLRQPYPIVSRLARLPPLNPGGETAPNDTSSQSDRRVA